MNTLLIVADNVLLRICGKDLIIHSIEEANQVPEDSELADPEIHNAIQLYSSSSDP